MNDIKTDFEVDPVIITKKSENSLDQIFHFISNQRLSAGFDESCITRHLLYSNESDAILKATVSHEVNFYIINDGKSLNKRNSEQRCERIETAKKWNEAKRTKFRKVERISKYQNESFKNS